MNVLNEEMGQSIMKLDYKEGYEKMTNRLQSV